MKKQLILHIGMGKTGTTALQDFFWSNRVRLKQNGILYPVYGSVANAHHLLSPHVPDNLKHEWTFKSVTEWAPKMAKTRFDKILLSSELSAWASKDNIVEFCRCLQERFSVSVVIYLRRQDNIIMANHNQLVKAGSRRRELNQTLENDIVRFDYWKIIEPWASCLGKSQVFIRPYEKQQFYRGDIRCDFMYHVFGIELSTKFVTPTGNSNPRLSPLAIAYKLFLYRIMSDADQVAKFNDALLSYSSVSDVAQTGIFSDQASLSASMRKQIISQSTAINQRIARELMGRPDGILFREPLPEDEGSWRPMILTAAEAKVITRYIESYNPHLLQLLFDGVSNGLTSLDTARRDAASFLKPALPPATISSFNERKPLSVFHWRIRPECRKGQDIPKMLISLHFPVVSVNGYESQLCNEFFNRIVKDYGDRPIQSDNFRRNLKAFGSCIRYAGLVYEGEKAICVHGHFMPLKYLFLQTRLRKRYVTWIKDPVNRLLAHYVHWKHSSNFDYGGELRRRMVDEDWSFEAFCFCPELRNIYSKFLWGFPLRSFDFIGIAEFPNSEMRRFSADVLGRTQGKLILDDNLAGHDTSSWLDCRLKEKIERYHAADVALYRRALEIRNMKLEELTCL